MSHDSEMQSVTQQTLADRLGLSRATISRSFTNHRGINTETRARVFDLAAEMGYRYLESRTPNKRRCRSTMTIGVLIRHASGSAEAEWFEKGNQKFLDGISQTAQLRAMQLDVHYVNPADTKLDDPSYSTIYGLRRNRWRGALLIDRFPTTVIEELLAKFPCVSLTEQDGGADLDCVDADHRGAVSQVMDVLVQNGHRRIGFYSTESDASQARSRFSAYFEKLVASGLPFRRGDAVGNVSSGLEITEQEALGEMLEQTVDGVTAWVCASDQAAYSVAAHLDSYDLRVPEMVSVTGFGGIKPPEGAIPITTVVVPSREIGSVATGRLYDLIKSPFDPAQHIFVDCQLRRGRSVGPVAVEG